MRPALFVRAALAFFLSAFSLSSLAAGDSLTFEEILRLARAGNAEVAASSFEAEGSRLGLVRAQADQGPSLSLFSRLVRYSAPHRIQIPAGVIDQDAREFNIGNETAGQLTFLATQDLYTGGATTARIEVASGEAAAGRARRDGATEDLALEVARAVVSLEKARGAVEVAREERGQAEAHREKARSFLESHLVTRLDLLEAEARLAGVDRKLLAGRTAADVSRARLNRLLGRRLDAPLDLAGGLPFRRPLPPLSECQRGARERRPELQLAHGAMERAHGQERLARSQSLPRVALFGNYTAGSDPMFLTSDPSFWSVGATVTWSLFDWGRRKADAGRAAALARSVEARALGAEEDVDLEVLEAHRAVEEKEAVLRSLEASVEVVRESLRLARERYAEGLGRGLDVLDAQTLWARTETELRAARLEAHLAGAQLLHAMGILSSTAMSPE